MEEIKISENVLNKFENSSVYRVKIENFEGPLDLLLYLIRDYKVDIQEIKLAEITEQYLLYMQDLNKIDMEMAAEFIEVAATMIEIKSKSLIPQEQQNLDNDDPENKLLQKLKEYKLFKEASESLRTIEDVNKFYKMPDANVGDIKKVLTDMNLNNLIEAFTKLLGKVQEKDVQEEPKIIERERWSVEDKIFEIKTLLHKEKKLIFKDMVDEDYTKLEIITLFISLLELLKMQQIRVQQNGLFGDIEISRGDEFNE